MDMHGYVVTGIGTSTRLWPPCRVVRRECDILRRELRISSLDLLLRAVDRRPDPQAGPSEEHGATTVLRYALERNVPNSHIDDSEHAAGRPGEGERWYVRKARQSRAPPEETNGEVLTFDVSEAVRRVNEASKRVWNRLDF